MERYVLSNYPYGAKDAVCGESPYKNGYLMLDRFEPFERFDVPGGTVRPVWLSLDVSANTPPGTYLGTVRNKRPDKYSKTLQVTIRVQPQLLPPPRSGRTGLTCGRTHGRLPGTTSCGPGPRNIKRC